MITLRQKLMDELDLRGFAPTTRKHYVEALDRLTRHYQRPTDQLSDDDLKKYLLYLIRERKLSASTITVNVCALRFFYRYVLERSTDDLEKQLPLPRARVIRPRVYSLEEVQRLLNAPGLNLKQRALLITTYSAGLRVSEVCHLKVTDIVSARMQLRVEQGKGRKDRYSILSQKLLQVLRGYWRAYRP